MKSEYVTIKTVDGKMVDGDITLGEKNRVSELFTDSSHYFIKVQDAIDFLGVRKEAVFFNKDHIIWVKPNEKKTTDKKEYLSTIKYEKVILKTIEGVVIEGKINLHNNANLSEYLEKSLHDQPFIIVIEAIDSNSNSHHTLFINKREIIFIESSD